MGVATDAQLSFGCLVKEDEYHPWSMHDEGFDGWVKDRLGYYNPHESTRRKSWSAYYDYKLSWEEENDYTLINYTSESYPSYVISLGHLSYLARRGYPTIIDPNLLQVNKESVQKLKSFIINHHIPVEDLEPVWWLSSYWER